MDSFQFSRRWLVTPCPPSRIRFVVSGLCGGRRLPIGHHGWSNAAGPNRGADSRVIGLLSVIMQLFTHAHGMGIASGRETGLGIRRRCLTNDADDRFVDPVESLELWYDALDRLLPAGFNRSAHRARKVTASRQDAVAVALLRHRGNLSTQLRSHIAGLDQVPHLVGYGFRDSVRRLRHRGLPRVGTSILRRVARPGSQEPRRDVRSARR